MMVKILNIRIDPVTFAEALQKAEDLISAKKPAQIVTVNPEIIMAAQKDQQFFNILNQADLHLADGTGIIWAAKKIGRPLAEKITGVDFSWALFKLAEEKGYSVYLLGGKPGVAQRAAENIKRVHPQIKFAGISSADPDDPNIVSDIIHAHPDILFVAYGAPKQEKFIHQHRFECLAIGVGGTFDYIAEVHPYAPQWMRKAGLEWLYRLLTQPKRFNRIITATVRFPWAVWRTKNKSKDK